MRFFILPVAVLAATVIATRSELEDDYEVFEKLYAVPHPWVLKDDGHVDADRSFKLRIHLKNRNIASFHKQVYDISTPGHPSYGRHQTREELNALLAPSKESFNLVAEWIEEEGLSEIAKIENDWIVLDSTIGDVEELLQTEFKLYKNTETGKTTVRTTEYSLPAALHAHVDIIAPTIKFSTPSAQRSMIIKDMTIPASALDNPHSGLDPVACNTTITPQCIKSLYNFNHFRGSRRNGNQFALAGFLEEYAQHADLAQFLKTYDAEAVGADFSEILINGGLQTQQNTTNVTQNMGEANLDIQYGLSLAYPTPTIYTSTGGRPPEISPGGIELDNEPYLEFLTYLLALETIPQTISISYGDGEQSVPPKYAQTVCNMFGQVAARGVSVLVSSGDSGSGSNCSVQNPNKLLYSPAFPAECPFVVCISLSIP
jgi:tripeptidyl-peptidase-1